MGSFKPWAANFCTMRWRTALESKPKPWGLVDAGLDPGALTVGALTEGALSLV